MTTQPNPRHHILTSNGVAGACAAALVLMKQPGASIRLTSTRHLPTALEELRETDYAGAIHLCNMDIDQPEHDTLRALAALGEGVAVTWYGGTEHTGLKRHRKAIEKRARLALSSDELGLGAIAQALRIPKSAQYLLLLELTNEARQAKKPRSESNRFCHDLVRAANRRFYFFGDDTQNEKVIRYLAGLEEETAELKHLVEQYRKSDDALHPLGSSKVMSALRKQIGRIGPIPESALIQGPTGSGKEVVARALHYTSERPGLFIAVNCAVLGGNPMLVEDRLFGHVKGAFTGAEKDAKGAFVEAHEGTLFLDEIGELPLEVQSQLLRVLEEKKVCPVGTMESRPVDVRIVAATHRDLVGMVRQAAFREDLYYRLNVLRIRVPALKERPDDMKSIAAHIAEGLAAQGYALKLSKKDWDAALRYEWPGNVRQFINVLKRAAYLQESVQQVIANEQYDAASSAIDNAELLRLYCPLSEGDVTPAQDVYQAYIRHVFDLLDGNITRTAQALDIAPNTLRKHLLEN